MTGKKRSARPGTYTGFDDRNPGRKEGGKAEYSVEYRKVHGERNNRRQSADAGRADRGAQRTDAGRQDGMEKRGSTARRSAGTSKSSGERRDRGGGQNGRGRRPSEGSSQGRVQKRSMVSDKKQKKKRRGKSIGRHVKRFFLAILGIGVIAGLLFFLFETQQIVVSGNQYCTDQEVTQWLRQDPYSENSLYVFWRYNQKDLKLPPAVEQVKVVLRTPRKVEVQVKEKKFAGRIAYQEQFLYFDREGVVSLIVPDVIEGVPYIEGLEVETEELRLGEHLPATDQEVFSEIGALTELMGEKDLFPDKIVCTGTELTLHFGGIRVQMGSTGFSEKLAQIPPILEKMEEFYPGQTGVLHLENYSVSDGSIRFVPDTAAEG